MTVSLSVLTALFLMWSCLGICAELAENDCAATIEVSGGPLLCAGETRTLIASSGAAYLWSTGESTQSIITGQPGTYSVVVTFEDGCEAETAQELTQLPSPSGQIFPSQQPPYCVGDQVTLIAVGTPFLDSFLWSTGATSQSISVAQGGLYSVVVTNAQGCTAEAFFPIGFIPVPNAVILTPDGTVACEGEEVMLSASFTPGGTYSWSNGSTGQTISVTTPGEYGLTVSNLAGCSSESEPVSVSFLPVTRPDLGEDVHLCAGDSVVLRINGPDHVGWQPGGQLSTEIIVSPTATTYYAVEVLSEGCGQGLRDSVLVTVSPQPIASFGFEMGTLGTTVLFYDESTPDSLITSWSWSFGDELVSLQRDPVHTFGRAGVFTVTLEVETLAGCKSVHEEDVSIGSEVVTSNVLTPNGDGLNDHVLFSDPVATTIEVSVFNRWGQSVWTAQGNNLRFQGRSGAGAELPSGVYFYSVASYAESMQVQVVNGAITLIRDPQF